MANSLEGKVCLVTGAGKGIGKEIVKLFLLEGGTVYANVRSDSAAKGLLSEIDHEHLDNVFPSIFDLTDTKSVNESILFIKKKHKKLDVLVNNAGVAYNEKIGMISYENMMEMFEINVISAINIMQLAARMMQRNNSGSIINISSMVGIHGDPGQCAYSASKGALIAATKSAAKELASFNIRVNSVAPGLTETQMMKDTDPSFLIERISNIGMKRLAKPLDIAYMCLFLASERSAYVTGQIIGVDGCAKI